MKLLEVLKILTGSYLKLAGYSEVLKQARFTEHGFHFVMATTPSGIQLEVFRKGDIEFRGIVTGKDNDLTTFIGHVQGLQDSMDGSYYASF